MIIRPIKKGNYVAYAGRLSCEDVEMVFFSRSQLLTALFIKFNIKYGV